MFRTTCLLLACLVPAIACAQHDKIATAHYVFLTEVVIRTPSKPDDTPVSDECENCGGTGRLGDGTIERVCPVCDGSGKRVTSNETPVSTAGWPPKSIGLKPAVAEAVPKPVPDPIPDLPPEVDLSTRFTAIPWVTMYTIPNCMPCEAAKRNVFPRLLGVIGKHRKTIKTVKDPGSMRFPTFVIRYLDRPPIVIVGPKKPMTAERIAALVSSLQRKPVR